VNLQSADDAPDKCSECGKVEDLTGPAGHLVCEGCRQVMDSGSDRYAVDTMMAMFARSRSWA
jgi:hypothetical protein